MLTLRITHDECTDLTEEDGWWRLISFNDRHISFKHPDNYIQGINRYGEVIPANIGIQRKLKCGTAFILSCYQHGGVAWSLKGEGMQCQWDTTQVAGVLLWNGSRRDCPAPDKRGQSAKEYLEYYTAWCNGWFYEWSLEDEDGNIIDSCGGCYNLKRLRDDVMETIERLRVHNPSLKFKVVGDCADLW